MHGLQRRSVVAERVPQAAYDRVQIERARNPQQDVEFPALLLEEMAVRGATGVLK